MNIKVETHSIKKGTMVTRRSRTKKVGLKVQKTSKISTPNVLEQEDFSTLETFQSPGGDVTNRTTALTDCSTLMSSKTTKTRVKVKIQRSRAVKKHLKVPETPKVLEQEELSAAETSQNHEGDAVSKPTCTPALKVCPTTISSQTTKSKVKVRSNEETSTTACFQKTPKLKITLLDMNNLDAILKRNQITMTPEARQGSMQPCQISPKLDSTMRKPKSRALKGHLKVPETPEILEHEKLTTTETSHSPGRDVENKTTETPAPADCSILMSSKTIQSQGKVMSNEETSTSACFPKTLKLEITPLDLNNLDLILKKYQITMTPGIKCKLLKPCQISPKLESTVEGPAHSSDGSVHLPDDSVEEETR